MQIVYANFSGWGSKSCTIVHGIHWNETFKRNEIFHSFSHLLSFRSGLDILSPDQFHEISELQHLCTNTFAKLKHRCCKMCKIVESLQEWGISQNCNLALVYWFQSCTWSHYTTDGYSTISFDVIEICSTDLCEVVSIWRMVAGICNLHSGAQTKV